jgi:hypothetical protein
MHSVVGGYYYYAYMQSLERIGSDTFDMRQFFVCSSIRVCIALAVNLSLSLSLSHMLERLP